MPKCDLTELALRAAVNVTKPPLSSDSGQADAIKSAALARMKQLVSAQGDGSVINRQIISQSMAIHLALEGLQLAYSAITKQMVVLNNHRLAFDKERQAGIATFMLPVHKEESDLSKEEHSIKAFLKLTEKSIALTTYFGIHSGDLLTNKGAKFHSVLPFYRMSDALGQPLESSNPLDRQRIAINLFFKSALPEAIADIDTSFQSDYKFTAFWESTFQRDNYLNNRRAPRFIMMSLSNLLWNLQHPVDPLTGFPLSINRCMELCREVELLLNDLLNSESHPHIQQINNAENGLISFLRKLEIHTKQLHAAYAEELLHTLNFEDITHRAHHALRVMDNSIFKLIYRKYNATTKKEEPDEKAAQKIAYFISYLNQLLIRNPELIKAFAIYPEWIPSIAEINKPPTTTIDILIIFCHLSWRERNNLLNKISRIPMDSAQEFYQTLKKFDKMVVAPIKLVSKKECQATVFHPKHPEVSRLTAQRLIPFLTLIIHDFRIEVDTELTIDAAKASRLTTKHGVLRTGKQQVQSINATADTGIGYYKWSLSPFLPSAKKLACDIDELPKCQYRMTQMSELLDSLSDLINQYRNFLQNKLFQAFLLKCLHRIRDEYHALEEKFDHVDLSLAQDERMSRSLQSILRPMTRDLNTCLEEFSIASMNFERIVGAPEFNEQQRQLLSLKLTSISEQFSSLFEEDSGIEPLIDSPLLITKTPKALQSPEKTVQKRQIVALKMLIQRCYDALSYQSRIGHKGLLIRELANMMDAQSDCTEIQIKRVILDLTRITASYRETWIFHASFGQTRSAKALIAAIKDPRLNKELPLASIIFDQSQMNIIQISDAQILKQLVKLKDGNLWQESSRTIQVNSLLTK